MILGPGPLHLDLDPDLGPGGPGLDFGQSICDSERKKSNQLAHCSFSLARVFSSVEAETVEQVHCLPVYHQQSHWKKQKCFQMQNPFYAS